jgi:hypothetical protein
VGFLHHGNIIGSLGHLRSYIIKGGVIHIGNVKLCNPQFVSMLLGLSLPLEIFDLVKYGCDAQCGGVKIAWGIWYGTYRYSIRRYRNI